MAITVVAGGGTGTAATGQGNIAPASRRRPAIGRIPPPALGTSAVRPTRALVTVAPRPPVSQRGQVFIGKIVPRPVSRLSPATALVLKPALRPPYGGKVTVGKIAPRSIASTPQRVIAPISLKPALRPAYGGKASVGKIVPRAVPRLAFPPALILKPALRPAFNGRVTVGKIVPRQIVVPVSKFAFPPVTLPRLPLPRNSRPFVSPFLPPTVASIPILTQPHLLAYVFLADPVIDGVTLAQPTAGVPCTLDALFGQTIGLPPGATSATLLLPSGVSLTTPYGAPTGGGHVASAAGYRVLDLGWTPNGVMVYLNNAQAAGGYWRLTFAAAGTYALSLAGSSFNVTVQAAAVPITPPIIPVSPTTPQLTLISRPLNRLASALWRLDWNGNYPSGGFDLLPAQIGVAGPTFGDINDTNLYRFVYDPYYWKMHVYGASGELATGAACAFSTLALFMGISD